MLKYTQFLIEKKKKKRFDASEASDDSPSGDRQYGIPKLSLLSSINQKTPNAGLPKLNKTDGQCVWLILCVAFNPTTV